MAKKSAVEKNNKRKRIVAARGARRAALKAIIADKNVSMEERFHLSFSTPYSGLCQSFARPLCDPHFFAILHLKANTRCRAAFWINII